MKIVTWDDDADPSIVMADGDVIVILDHPIWDNLEKGDMIQHTNMNFGTSCYFVVKVQETNPAVYERGMKLVTIKGAI